jgi:Super-infection exclusion protein B
MDWISKLFDIGKLPAKIVAWIAILSGGVLFLPGPLLSKLHLDSLNREYGLWIGLAFAASSTLLGINLMLWLWHSGRQGWSRRKWRSGLQDVITALDPSEMAILREFYLQEKSTLRLPIDDPSVAGLMSKGILQGVGTLGESSMVGILFPLAIASPVKKVLNPHAIGFPTTSNVTDADRQRISNSRPEFVKRLGELDWLRNG